MNDYTYPSVFFAYLFFAISVAVCAFFLVRSWKDGYWGRDGEEVKFRVFDEGDGSLWGRPPGLPRAEGALCAPGRPGGLPHKDERE